MKQSDQLPTNQMSDADYAAMLAGGNATVAWHSIAGEDWTFDTVNAAVEKAIYNAVRQVFSDRLKIELPAEMPELFGEEG